MKVTPVAGPAQIPVNGTPEHVRTAKAIAAFNKGASSYDAPPQQEQQQSQQRQQPQQRVVQNQSQIEVEEIGAIIPQPNIDTQTGSEQLEAVAEETPQEQKPVQDPALSRQFAQLARQEKALRQKAQQQDQALKAREAALAEREARLTSQPATDLSKYIPKDRFLQDPISVLEENGLNYDDLTQRYVTRAPVDPSVTRAMQAMQDEIRELKAQTAKASEQQTEAQKQAYAGAIKQIRNDVVNLVRQDPAFETIKQTQSIDDVVELIEETYKQDGIVLSVDEAAKQVEEYLVEEAMKLTRIGKIQQRLQSSSNGQQTLQAQQRQNAQPQQKQPGSMKTLTNATSSNRQLSAKERAILAFKGELHKG